MLCLFHSKAASVTGSEQQQFDIQDSKRVNLRLSFFMSFISAPEFQFSELFLTNLLLFYAKIHLSLHF